jgi:ribonuclease HII
VAVAASSAALIDRRGIRKVTLDAMRRAIIRLQIGCPVQIDGLDVPPGLTLPCTAIVRGDACVPQIAAASIVAKVTRDRLMVRLAAHFPGYGWERNVGYGTAEHLEAIARLGPTPHHRLSYSPLCQRDLAFIAEEAVEIES